MNDSLNSYQSPFSMNTQLADRLLAIYSLILILVGTPCNLLCTLVYLKKHNRTNSIKVIFGYLSILDTIVLYTFNLNYVVREFNIDYQLVFHPNNSSVNTYYFDIFDHGYINLITIKKNIEEYSLFACRSLSYLAFSILQTSSWILAFGSLNRFLLISNSTRFQFVCKRTYTTVICCSITCLFFLANAHILWLNGYRSSEGKVVCYQNRLYPGYVLLYQRVHLCLYSAFPSILLFISNFLLMRIIFASKKRLNVYTRQQLSPLNASAQDSEVRRLSLKRPSLLSTISSRAGNKHMGTKTPNRHSRKLTLSLIFITLSYFILTFPSTVIFSFFRPFIEPLSLRRTLSLFCTNLSTTTHVIRFFIYYFCSTDFRSDFYNLLRCKRSVRC